MGESEPIYRTVCLSVSLSRSLPSLVRYCSHFPLSPIPESRFYPALRDTTGTFFSFGLDLRPRSQFRFMPPRVFLFGITVCSSIFPPAGMGADLLESIFVPAAAAAAATEGAAAAQAAASEEETASAASSSSQPRENYNVLLMEKLLRMLYASCQYGEQSRRLCAADGISRFSFKMRPRPPMLGWRARHIPATYGIWLQGN